MPWSRSAPVAPGLPEVESIEQCTSLMKQTVVVFFKHSPTCPVSWMAHREVMKFRNDYPDLPLHLISVRNYREVSRFVAEQTGIEHESPQVIVFRDGKAIGNASHDDVTAEFIMRTAGLQ